MYNAPCLTIRRTGDRAHHEYYIRVVLKAMGVEWLHKFFFILNTYMFLKCQASRKPKVVIWLSING